MGLVLPTGFLEGPSVASRENLRGSIVRILHFLHIGKTGGSAIRHALSTAGHGTAGWRITLHGHTTCLEHIPPGESVFFFLRNPITRFVSGFYSRQRQGRPKYFFPWTSQEHLAFSLFDNPEALATELTSSDTDRRMAAMAAMNSIQHVRDTYWNWFGNENYFQKRIDDIFFIGRQESLTADFERLKKLLGLDLRIKLPQDDLIAHRNPAHCDYHLSAPAVENLKKWYEADFHFLRICERIKPRLPGESVVPPGPDAP